MIKILENGKNVISDELLRSLNTYLPLDEILKCIERTSGDYISDEFGEFSKHFPVECNDFNITVNSNTNNPFSFNDELTALLYIFYIYTHVPVNYYNLNIDFTMDKYNQLENIKYNVIIFDTFNITGKYDESLRIKINNINSTQKEVIINLFNSLLSFDNDILIHNAFDFEPTIEYKGEDDINSYDLFGIMYSNGIPKKTEKIDLSFDIDYNFNAKIYNNFCRWFVNAKEKNYFKFPFRDILGNNYQPINIENINGLDDIMKLVDDIKSFEEIFNKQVEIYNDSEVPLCEKDILMDEIVNITKSEHEKQPIEEKE